MTRKQDYGVLLEKFGDGKSRPEADTRQARLQRRGRVAIDPAIRLPTLAVVLEIDRRAEAAAVANIHERRN